MKHLLFTVLLSLFTGLFISQTYAGQNQHESGIPCSDNPFYEGSLWIYAHPYIDNLIAEKKQKRLKNPGINGFRIQLTFSYHRSDVLETEAKFRRKYPDIPAYVVYEQPYFKLRVGDYRNLMEAQSFYYKLIEEFSTVFIVPTLIEFPKLGS